LVHESRFKERTAIQEWLGFPGWIENGKIQERGVDSMLSLQDLRSKRGAILACAKGHGARKLRVFGSVSRGEEEAHSDVDFLVRYEPERSLIDHIQLIEELAALLQVDVDVVSEEALSPYARDTILREAVDL
jgi:predicted nucleotidyltransferase